MSTQPVAPDSSNLASAVAPQVTMPPQAAPQFPPAAPQTPTQAPATSRLQAVLQAVSSVDTSQPSPKDVNPQPSTLSRAVSTGLSAVGAGIAGAANQKGRASFAGGMTGGANAELQQQAMDQDVKFKSMDDQIRLAELHNQDIKLQNDTQAQTDAHIKAELDNRSLANDLGIDFDTIANHGGAVMDHLAAQTAANGSATVPPGTHVSADGDTIYIPTDTQKTRDGQMAMYSKLAPALGLPSLPEGAQFVPSKLMNIFTNKINGFALNGDPINHDALPALIASTQTQRDNLAKNGGNEVQLKTLDNLLGIYKANLNALDEHAATVTKNNAQSKKSGEIAAQLTPEGQALDQRNQANKIAAQDNAAANRPKPDATELNVVAFDPDYQNTDGSSGANVVMSKQDAAAKGLSHYKADPQKLNATVAGFNDVQNKINMLADVANDPSRMGKVQPDIAAALMESGDGVQLGAFGTRIDMTKINANLYAHNMEKANQATKDYVTAMLGAHEAITQLPRLQTFGQSSRMTQQQMQAAQKLLPQPGDGAAVAKQKMVALQQMLDPLRKQVPHMPGAEQIPSWTEKQSGQQAAVSH